MLFPELILWVQTMKKCWCYMSSHIQTSQFIIYVIDFFSVRTFGDFNLIRFNTLNASTISWMEVIPIVSVVDCLYRALRDRRFLSIATYSLHKKWAFHVTKHGFSKNLLCIRISKLVADHATHTNVYWVTPYGTPHSIIGHLDCTSKGKTGSY